MRVAIAVVDDDLALRPQSGDGVVERWLEEVAVDIGEGRRARIGRIDDVHASFRDRNAADGEVEVVMQQDARQAADL